LTSVPSTFGTTRLDPYGLAAHKKRRAIMVSYDGHKPWTSLVFVLFS